MIAPDIGTVAALVKDRCGLTCDGDGNQALVTALGKRMPAVGIASVTAYAARLLSDPDEFGALINLLTINETYFYREPEHLTLLVRRLGRILGRRSAGDPIRILCAGCSSGEEPYSVVIAIKEAFGEAALALFSILSIDIDSDALARAREGRYWELSFRSMPDRLKGRYFTADPTGSRLIAADIRAAVRFQHVNLVADESDADMGRFDAILFRNVSIYFDTPTRRRMVARLAGMLADQGCLIVGAAETLSNDFGLLKLVEEDGVFYFIAGEHPPTSIGARPGPERKAPPRRPARSPRPVPIVATSAPPIVATLAPPIVATLAPPKPIAGPPGQDLADAARLIREKRYDDALALIEQLPAGPDGGRLRAQILFNRSQLEAAEREALLVVASQPWCTDTLILLGQIARLRHDHERAIRWLKQAVYARPESWLAHFCLAEAYRRSGSTDKARREYGVVVQQLSTPAASKEAEPLFPLAVAPEDLRKLCQRHLAELGGSR